MYTFFTSLPLTAPAHLNATWLAVCLAFGSSIFFASLPQSQTKTTFASLRLPLSLNAVKHIRLCLSVVQDALRPLNDLNQCQTICRSILLLATPHSHVRSFSYSITHLFTHSCTSTLTHSIDQSINQSVNQSIRQSINQSINQALTN